MGKESQLIWKIVVAILAAYLIGLIVFAGGVHGTPGHGNGKVQGDVVFGAAIVAGAAVAAVSGLLGFLFGVPRAFSGASRNGDPGKAAVQANGESGPNGSGDSGGLNGQKGPSVGGNEPPDSWNNDNLSEVSDWLTKIVVGVGLVQFAEIVDWLEKIGRGLGEGAGLTAPLATTFGVTVILLNFGVGFFVAYIFVRTRLTKLFAAAYNETQQQLRGELNKIEQVQRAQELTARNTENMVRGVANYMGGPAAVLADLYRPPPKGYDAALKKTDELIESPEFKNNPVVWGYRACALGQKFGHEKQQGQTPEELAEIAEAAYEAVNQTLQLDRNRKGWLRALWNPNDPNHMPGENDLTPLYHDPDQRARFRTLLD